MGASLPQAHFWERTLQNCHTLPPALGHPALLQVRRAPGQKMLPEGPLCCLASPVWQRWSHRWSCSSQLLGSPARNSSSSVGPQRAASIAEGRGCHEHSELWDTWARRPAAAPQPFTCGLMLWGMPASTSERSFSERGRETAILSQVRSPTSWLWVNSRWACQRSLCGGSSSRDTPSSLLGPASAPSAGRQPGALWGAGGRMTTPCCVLQSRGPWASGQCPNLVSKIQSHIPSSFPRLWLHIPQASRPANLTCMPCPAPEQTLLALPSGCS